ncbi:MAG: hypothetical protein PHQ05_10255 [Sterolibacterium sp.]|nr:hypothetical protein [Sterolibacterium sp.]
MNMPTTRLPALEIPAFLERREPLAQYGLWSNGRFLIVKDDVSISLSQDDLRELRRYFDQFDNGAS